MADFILNARLQQLSDIEENWNKKVTFVPKAGELVIYLPDSNHDSARLKIGDGIKTVVNLSFIKSENIEGIDLNNIVAAKVAHKLIFGSGTYQYDGSEDVVVPVYTGDHN